MFFLFVLLWLISSLILRIWSVVLIPFLPPAWLLVILMVVRILLLSSLSNVLPMLLERVIPLSLQHLPLVPLPLYSLMTSPLSHCLGIARVFAMLLNTSKYRFFVWALASVRAVFGILSGPGALCLCKFVMTLLSSSIVKGMGILSFVEFLNCSILSMIVFCGVRIGDLRVWLGIGFRSM